jgi:hypothetical protein
MSGSLDLCEHPEMTATPDNPAILPLKKPHLLSSHLAWCWVLEFLCASMDSLSSLGPDSLRGFPFVCKWESSYVTIATQLHEYEGHIFSAVYS